jgi:hypothetical protein
MDLREEEQPSENLMENHFSMDPEEKLRLNEGER